MRCSGEHDPAPQTSCLPVVLSLGVLVDIDPSDTAHFLLGKLSCLCGGLTEGKDLELCVGVQACTLEGKVLLGEMGRKKTHHPTKSLHVLEGWRNTVISDFVKFPVAEVIFLTFPL